MRMLRTILLVLAFAAADLAVPVGPSALEVADQVDDSGYHVSRRGGPGRTMTPSNMASKRWVRDTRGLSGPPT